MTKCIAIKNNKKSCKQTDDLDVNGYCKYHRGDKFKVETPKVETPKVETPKDVYSSQAVDDLLDASDVCVDVETQCDLDDDTETQCAIRVYEMETQTIDTGIIDEDEEIVDEDEDEEIVD